MLLLHRIYKYFPKLILFSTIFITYGLFIDNIIRVYLELSEPIIVKGIIGVLIPPSKTSYGGILLNDNSFYLQSSDYSCGPKALVLACQILGINITEKKITWLAKTHKEGTSMLGLAKAANKIGLKSCGLFLTYNDLKKVKKPAIIFISNNHFVVINKIIKDKILITDPLVGRVLLEKKIFITMWRGYVLAIEKDIECGDN